MASRKNHHFVPQFYFRFFTGEDNCINVLRRENGRIHNGGPIKGQACKKLFYGSDSIESALGIMEGAAATALKALIALQNPMLADDEQVGIVLAWLALQRARTQAARDSDQPAQDRMLRLMLEVQINSDENLTDEQAQEMLDTLPDICSNPAHSQAVRMKGTMEMSGAMSDLTPIMLTNKTNRPFIFGDAPVIFYNSYYRRVVNRGVLGMDTPGLMVFFPLGPKTTLLLLDSACYSVKGARNHQIQIRHLRDVAALNKLQIHASSTCVYFHDKAMERYVKHLWDEEKNSLRNHEGRVIEAPGYHAGTGEALGDILHIFEPQLPYRLRLSFLEYREAEEHDYGFSRRSDRYGSL
jgi:hypothetical protein